MIFVPGRLLCKGVDDRIFVEAGVCKEKKMNWGTVPAGNIAAWRSPPFSACRR
jgi:hypothetical protein